MTDYAETQRAVNKPIRQRAYELLITPELDQPVERIFNWVMIILIALNVLAVILETEASISEPYRIWFDGFEVFSVVVFTLEYFVRIWSVTLDPRFRHPVTGRLRFILQPLSLIDLAAFLPFYLPWLGVDLRILRSLRLFRLFRLLKISHYSSSMRTFSRVLQAKRTELSITMFAGLILLVLASSIMYVVERPYQPEVFSSIPASMWWGVATLTTIGYGDIYPKTVLGKVFGSFIALLGIGLFALPTGILASGFASEIQHGDETSKTCPHCGKEL